MAFEIAKVDDAQRLVFGFANVSIAKDGGEVVDLQGDIIEPSELEAAAYEFVLKFRETGEMHKGAAVGKLVESMVFTPEKLEALGIAKDAVPCRWWVGFQLDDDAFAKVKDGTYRMFSIQGRADREEVEV
jgi:hypothetical protein